MQTLVPSPLHRRGDALFPHGTLCTAGKKEQSSAPRIKRASLPHDNIDYLTPARRVDRTAHTDDVARRAHHACRALRSYDVVLHTITSSSTLKTSSHLFSFLLSLVRDLVCIVSAGAALLGAVTSTRLVRSSMCDARRLAERARDAAWQREEFVLPPLRVLAQLLQLFVELGPVNRHVEFGVVVDRNGHSL